MDKETGREKGKVTYTVDDVKEAFAVLGDGEKRAEYDGWLARVGNAAAVGMGGKGAGDGDGFLLGLEVLDLSDFEAGGAAAGIGGALIEWTRPCRCGAEKGYRIQEKELEDAEERGETEVLVGCEGCSLWVRVGFEVQEG
ncbi:hypothetical protein CC80DRAFT_428828 [Byssothecium circinans]|uniref:DPH-type MB domain-containing protein n=1 Tax=Byssothecium circinans TaxID=147558 RepID=A0A6A5TBB0_9PLEO|nr:hypothetical protein CC80DRAFT_428828 [Byssothecium circinans]